MSVSNLHVAPKDDAGLSRIVAGTWRMADWGFNTAERVRWIEECLVLDITSFDHADIYGGYTVEALFGEALAATFAKLAGRGGGLVGFAFGQGMVGRVAGEHGA